MDEAMQQFFRDFFLQEDFQHGHIELDGQRVVGVLFQEHDRCTDVLVVTPGKVTTISVWRDARYPWKPPVIQEGDEH